MGESCSIDAHVRNKDGQVVVSNLWKDLIEFTNNNRQLTQQYYALGTNTAFLNSVRRRAKFDENGQITFASLLKLGKLEVREDDIIKKIRGDFKASNLSFEMAVESVNHFNKSSDFKKKYMATLYHDGNGTYTVDVVHRNKANETVLKDLLKQKALQDFLIKKLKELHCNVDFVENVSYKGMYDTTEIEKLYDCTYTLIRLSKNIPIEEQNKALAKEIGHFVLGVLGKDNNLVKRLDSILDSQVVESYRQLYEINATYATNKKREVMGHLIGDAIYDKLTDNEKTSAIGRLLSRIKNYVFSIFKKGDEKLLYRALADVDVYVSRAAEGFINGNSAYDLEAALKREGGIQEEVLFASEKNEIYEGLERVVLERKRLADLMKAKKQFQSAKAIKESVDRLIDSFIDNKGQSEEDLRFLQRAIQIAYNDIELELADAEFDLNAISNANDFVLKRDLAIHADRLYAAGAKISSAIRAQNILRDLKEEVSRKLGDRYTSIYASEATDFDLFTGKSSNAKLDDFDNSAEVFDRIDKLSKLFEDSSGRVNRTSGYYEDRNGNKYVRFHRILEVDDSGKAIPSNKNSEKNYEGESFKKAEFGSRTDAFLRVMFDSKGKNFSEAVEAANAVDIEIPEGENPTYFDLNNSQDREYLEGLQKEAINLMQHWANQGIKWKASNLTVSTQLNKMRIAGEMDLLLLYPDGHLEVWDMKTSTLDPNNEYSPRKNENYLTQVNFYARALRDNGFKAMPGGVLQINKNYLGKSVGMFQFHVKPRVEIDQLEVSPFKNNKKSFEDVLSAQRTVEIREQTGTTVETNDKTDDTVPNVPAEILKASEDEVLAYVKTYHPDKHKAVTRWFTEGGSRINKPYLALVQFDIIPTSVTKFKTAQSANPHTQLYASQSRINKSIDRLVSTLDIVFNRLSCTHMVDVYGKDIIKVASKGLAGSLRDGYYVREKDDERTAEEVLSSVDSNMNFIQYLFRPYGRYNDIPSQIIAKTIELANEMADRATYETTIKLLEARRSFGEALKKEGSSKSLRAAELELFERDEKGNLTCYYISEVKYYLYNQELEKFIEENKIEGKKFKEFLEKKTGQSFENIDETYKTATWSTWYSKKWEIWHEGTKSTEEDSNGNRVIINSDGNSIKVDGVYVPNPKLYHNDAYDLLSEAQKEYLKTIIETKKSLDELLGNPRMTETMRAPQINAHKKVDYFWNRTPDSIRAKGLRWLAFKLSLKTTANDIEYGNDITENDKKHMLAKAHLDPKTHVSEIPTFFIKKLKDPNMMSTDIVGGLVAYASMAQSYSALSKIGNTLEIFGYTLTKRSVKNANTSLSDLFIRPVDQFALRSVFSVRKNSDELFARSQRAYLEMVLYSRSVASINRDADIWMAKASKMLKAVTSYMFLGGNLHGAAVNVMTGFNEMFKEAIVGEDITEKGFLMANAMFFENLPSLLIGVVQQVPTSTTAKHPEKSSNAVKLNAWMRYFNTRGDNAYQDKHKATVRIAPFTLNDFIMSPYTAGDYYMQSISYLASALTTTVYDSNGNKYKMFDVYTDNKGMLEVLPETYFLSEEFAKDYSQLKKLKNLLFTKLNLNDGNVDNIQYTSEEQALLEKYGIDFRALELNAVYNKLQSLFDKQVLGAAFEVDYAMKCREINDRMHGIYNKMNRTAFHSTLLGSLLTSLRGYLFGYFERDFTGTREDIALGRSTEGAFRTLFKYWGYSFHEGFREGLKAVLYSTIVNCLYSLPAINPVTKKLGEKIFGKDLSFKGIMSRNSELGDFQSSNLLRLGTRINLILFLHFILAPALLKWSIGDDDDDDNDKSNPLLRFFFYLVKRAGYEQSAGTLVFGLVLAIIKGESYTTGWSQELGRNSSVMPMQLLAVISLFRDIYYLVGMALGDSTYTDPEKDPENEQYPGEPDTDYRKRIEEWSAKHNKFYNSTHYTKNDGVTWLKDNDGKRIFDDDGRPIPKYSTAFDRALHGEYMVGDPRFLKDFIRYTPNLKSIRVYHDSQKLTKDDTSVKALDNWTKGQTSKQ